MLTDVSIKVIGFGDHSIDNYVEENLLYPGGNSLNYSVYSKMLGISSAYLGTFADDDDARYIKQVLSSLSIDYSMCPIDHSAMTEKCDVIIHLGERTFVENLNRNYSRIPKLPVINDSLIDYLSGFTVIHTSCYSSNTKELKKLIKARRTTVFDFSWEPMYRSTDYLDEVCPFVDIGLFSCADLQDDEIISLAQTACSKGIKIFIATLGARGQFLYDGGIHHNHLAIKEKVQDTMGAGDAFIAAFIAFLLNSGSWNIEQIYDKSTINQSLVFASNFAKRICAISGSFGHGKYY